MSATSDRNVALYSILVDGSEVDESLSKRIREVRILSYLRLPDMCTLSVVYQKGNEGEDQPIDSHPFDIGKSLEIKLGARDQLTTTSLFKGQMVSQELNFGAGGVELMVRGYDRSHALIRARNVRTFQNQTTSDIVSKVLGEAGFSAQCDSTGDPHDFMQQDNETDWDFIWRLAERVGFEFVVQDTKAYFRKPNADSPVELDWPQTLRSFSPRVTATQQAQQVTLGAFDPKTKQAIGVTVSSPEQVARIGVERSTVASAFDGADIHIATEPVKSQSRGSGGGAGPAGQARQRLHRRRGRQRRQPQHSRRHVRAGERPGPEVQRAVPRRRCDPRPAWRGYLRDALRQLAVAHVAGVARRRPREWRSGVRRAARRGTGHQQRGPGQDGPGAGPVPVAGAGRRGRVGPDRLR